jgi:hypothetical protein
MVTTSGATTATAGEARHQNSEELGNCVDYALEDSSDSVDDGHDTVTDGTEQALNLKGSQQKALDEVIRGWLIGHTHETTAPILAVYVVCLFVL